MWQDRPAQTSCMLPFGMTGRDGPVTLRRRLESPDATARERRQAMPHLDRAGELFSHYRAKLYLDQVLVANEILRAYAVSSRTGGDHATGC